MTDNTSDLVLAVMLVRNDFTRELELVLVQDRTKRGEKFYKLPGGKIKQGESLEEAIAREVHEETTISTLCGAGLWKYEGARSGLQGTRGTQPYTVHLFSAEIAEDDVEPFVRWDRPRYTEGAKMFARRVSLRDLKKCRIKFLPKHREHVKVIRPLLHTLLFEC